MKPNIIQIRKSINKAFLKVKPNRTQIETFKINIINLYDQINEAESEEFHKNIISKFLNDTYYALAIYPFIDEVYGVLPTLEQTEG